LDDYHPQDDWVSRFKIKCSKKFKKDGDDLVTVSPVSIVLGAILGLFWRYEYKPGWSPEPLPNNTKRSLKFLSKLLNKSLLKKEIFLPKKEKLFVILKSPHVNKKSREHFIFKNYIQKIEIEFISIFELINFLIHLKKNLTKNFLIHFKIIKK
jgi:ribosomal protein S10